MSQPDPCTFLDWDSDFFGKKIARVNGNTLSEESLAEIDAWSHQRSVDCLYFIGQLGDRETVELATRSGFALVDIRVTLERAVDTRSAVASAEKVRNWKQSDLPALEAIARKGFHDTRFYADGRFPTERCDDLYAHWIRTSCHGYAQSVLVWDEGDGPHGFVTCNVATDGKAGSIGLIGVDERSRGKGVGSALVRSALHWFAQRLQVQRISVVTQGRNISAQRIYQRCGFLSASMELYFHKWFK